MLLYKADIVSVITLRFCLLTETYFTQFAHTIQHVISTHIPENLLQDANFSED